MPKKNCIYVLAGMFLTFLVSHDQMAEAIGRKYLSIVSKGHPMLFNSSMIDKFFSNGRYLNFSNFTEYLYIDHIMPICLLSKIDVKRGRRPFLLPAYSIFRSLSEYEKDIDVRDDLTQSSFRKEENPG